MLNKATDKLLSQRGKYPMIIYSTGYLGILIGYLINYFIYKKHQHKVTTLITAYIPIYVQYFGLSPFQL